jgi:hypothetical protein
MYTSRIRPTLSAAVLLAVTALGLSGCGAMEPTRLGAKLPVNEAQTDARQGGSDGSRGSPRNVTGAGAETGQGIAGDQKSRAEEEEERPPLDVPDEPYPKPKFPDPPPDDSDELDRIEFQLKKVAWTSAGFVAKAEEDCTIDADELMSVGEYNFDCSVSFADVTTKFAVTAVVKDKAVNWKYSVKKLPISEEKAVYEATRQSYKPAMVTCDIVDVEPVRVGQESGLTCWVTDVTDNRSSYRGLLEEDGTLAFQLPE